MFFFAETLLNSSSASKGESLLVRILGLPVTESNITREHPDYPNFLSINDILAKYVIKNIVADFEFEKPLNQPPPFVIVKGEAAHSSTLRKLNGAPQQPKNSKCDMALELGATQVLSREQLKKIGGGFDGSDDGGGSGTGCGVNYYDTYGVKYEEVRNISKADAISIAADWNAYHQSTCGTNCGAVAKWCCASC